MPSLRELLDGFRFRFILLRFKFQGYSKKRIRVAMLVHNLDAWDALSDLYERMCSNSNFQAIIFEIPKNFPGMEQECFERDLRIKSYFKELSIPTVYLGEKDESLFLKNFDPEFVFRQSPWEKDIPAKYRLPLLGCYKVCYIPYGFTSIESYGKDLHGDPICTNYFTDSCDLVFVETSKHMESYIMRGEASNKYLTGYPKFEKLLRNSKIGNARWPIDRVAKLRLIWAPHHSLDPNWLGFGTFHLNYKDFESFARDNPDIDIILRPHPALFRFAVSSGYMNQDEMDRFLCSWDILPNTCLDIAGSYTEIFAASDLMITDGISFLFEYQIIDKPLIFLDSGHHVSLHPGAIEVLNSVYKFQNINDVFQKILEFKDNLRGADSLSSSRKNIIQYLIPYPNESANRILSTLKERSKLSEVTGKN